MAFECSIVTPEKIVFEGTIIQAVVAAHDGSIGILTNRAPLLSKLGVGSLRLDLPDGQKRFFLIDGGVAQMKDNELTVLTQECIPAEELDVQQAEAELSSAQAQKIQDDASFQQHQHRLARARAIRELIGK